MEIFRVPLCSKSLKRGASGRPPLGTILFNGLATIKSRFDTSLQISSRSFAEFRSVHVRFLSSARITRPAPLLRTASTVYGPASSAWRGKGHRCAPIVGARNYSQPHSQEARVNRLVPIVVVTAIDIFYRLGDLVGVLLDIVQRGDCHCVEFTSG